MYLTADPSARAVRRTAENGAGSVDATEADLIRRDAIDSGRATAPLTVPDGRGPHRHHAVHAAGGRRPGRGAGARHGRGGVNALATRGLHEDLPRTTGVRGPHTWALRGLGGTCRAIIRRWYDVQITGQQHFPAAGPVVVAANHSGFIDGPLMAIMAPRPLHALTKREMFAGAMGPFLRQSGQIPIWRETVDPFAVRTALRVAARRRLRRRLPRGNTRRR